MSGEDKKRIDPELEKFLRENKEMMSRLFSEEKEMMERFFKEEKEHFRGAFDEEMKRAEEFADRKKEKAKEAAKTMFDAFADPEVQKHFMAMGMEFMLGMNALMKAMPVPDCMKDMADKAEKARKEASENFSKAAGGKASKPSAPPEKINVEPAPKKKPAAAKDKTPPKGKASD